MEHCCKDVRQEVGEGRAGEYLCADCRKSIQEDPVAQIIGILEKDGAGEKGGGPIPIKGYEIKRKLGEGGFGTVYLAEKMQSRERVAVKVMLPRVAPSTSSWSTAMRAASPTCWSGAAASWNRARPSP